MVTRRRLSPYEQKTIIHDCGDHAYADHIYDRWMCGVCGETIKEGITRDELQERNTD